MIFGPSQAAPLTGMLLARSRLSTVPPDDKEHSVSTHDPYDQPIGDKAPLSEERKEPPVPPSPPEGEPPPPREPDLPSPDQEPPIGDPQPRKPPIGDPPRRD